MEIFRNLRLSRGKSALRKKLARLKRVKFRGNIFSATKVGLLWDATNPDDLNTVSQFCQKMLERNIDVKVLGFYPGKELPDKLTAIRFLTCIKSNELTITYKPVGPESSEFMNSNFNILIDANFRNLFPLQYISSLSRAGFKVGIFDNGYEDPQFDLMIETGKIFNLADYLNQALHYLEMINNKTSPQQA